MQLTGDADAEKVEVTLGLLAVLEELTHCVGDKSGSCCADFGFFCFVRVSGLVGDGDSVREDALRSAQIAML